MSSVSSSRMIYICYACGKAVKINDPKGRAGMCRYCSQHQRFREILEGKLPPDRQTELREALEALRQMKGEDKATLTEEDRSEALESMLDELLMLDPEYKSSGWDKMSDTQLSDLFVESPTLRDKWPRPLLRDRGITIKECSVCDKENLHHDHDYMCIPCRRL